MFPQKPKILISPEIWKYLANIYCDECLPCVLNRELKIGVGFFDLVGKHTNKFFSPLCRQANLLTLKHFQLFRSDTEDFRGLEGI